MELAGLPTRTKHGDKWQMGEHRLIVPRVSDIDPFRHLALPLSHHIFTDIAHLESAGPVLLSKFDGNASFICNCYQVSEIYNFYNGRIFDVVAIRVMPDITTIGRVNGYVEDLNFIICVTRFGINDRNLEPTANRSRLINEMSFPDGFSTDRSIEIWENQMLLMSLEGDIVLDPVAYQGCCMMACIRSGRISYNIESDMYNADLILSRYESATGSKAVKVGSWR